MEIREFIGNKVIVDEGVIFGVNLKDHLQMIAQIRGWGAIQHLFELKGGKIDIPKAEEFQDQLGQWIAKAINEKLERERNGYVSNYIIVHENPCACPSLNSITTLNGIAHCCNCGGLAKI